MGTKDIKLGTLMGGLAWLRDAALVTLGTPPGSPERRQKLDELSATLGRAKQAAAGYRGKMADELRLGVQAAELGVNRLRRRSTEREAQEGGGDEARESGPGERVHPRRRSLPRGGER